MVQTPMSVYYSLYCIRSVQEFQDPSQTYSVQVSQVYVSNSNLSILIILIAGAFRILRILIKSYLRQDSIVNVSNPNLSMLIILISGVFRILRILTLTCSLQDSQIYISNSNPTLSYEGTNNLHTSAGKLFTGNLDSRDI